MPFIARAILALVLALVQGMILAGPPPVTALRLAASFHDQVDHQLVLPIEEATCYGERALEALSKEGIVPWPQYVALVDRNPNVQAIAIFWLDNGAPPFLVGAAAVSTGRGGAFDHFETPLGVFALRTDNPDFRAEGTRNKTRRPRLWREGNACVRPRLAAGCPSLGTGRLQRDATADACDRSGPARAALGGVQSKGCVRIPATLNRLLDHFGVLDADYLAAAAQGVPMWAPPADQEPIEGAGRYVIIVDSGRAVRPNWSRIPGPRTAAVPPAIAPPH
jgi:hypothetical protein